MQNFYNKLIYYIKNYLKLKTKPHLQNTYELVSNDDLRNNHNWVTVHPNTTTFKKNLGATIILDKYDNKTFATPTIISKSTFQYGKIVVNTSLNNTRKICNKLILKHKSCEIGFKIINKEIYIISPNIDNKIIKFKLFNPDQPHDFEIEIKPKSNLVIWRIDNVTIFKKHLSPQEYKHMIISLTPLNGKISPKFLPQSLVIHNVKFIANNTLI